MHQCELLDLCRSSLYYQPQPVSPADLRFMRRIDELHLRYPFFGARRLAQMLQREGFAVGRRHGGTLMHLMGIEAIYRKKRTSLSQKGHKIYPYLLSHLAIERPNQVWAADISYLPMARGFAYLVGHPRFAQPQGARLAGEQRHDHGLLPRSSAGGAHTLRRP